MLTTARRRVPSALGRAVALVPTELKDDDVDDNESGEVIRRSDLSHEVATGRAEVHLQLEKVAAKIGDDGVEVSTESYPGSPQNKAGATFCLAAAVSAITWTAWGIGLAPVFALAIGLGTAVGLYLLVHRTR
jgi:hypothetical protein